MSSIMATLSIVSDPYWQDYCNLLHSFNKRALTYSKGNSGLAELVSVSMLYKNLAYIGDNQQLSVTAEEIHNRKHNKSTTRVIQKCNREVGQTPLSFIFLTLYDNYRISPQSVNITGFPHNIHTLYHWGV